MVVYVHGTPDGIIGIAVEYAMEKHGSDLVAHLSCISSVLTTFGCPCLSQFLHYIGI